MASTDITLHRAHWRRSSYSNGSGGNCLEVAFTGGGIIPVRDSKTAPGGAMLTFSASAWGRFVTALQSGALAPS